MSDQEFPKKILDKIPPDLADSIPLMKEDELRQRIVKSEAEIVDLDKEMEDDIPASHRLRCAEAGEVGEHYYPPGQV